MFQKTRRTFSVADFEQVAAMRQCSDNREQIIAYKQFLAHAVKALPAKQQETINLYYGDGMTMTQAAQYLDVSVSTIWRRLQSAKQILRRIAKICMDAGLLR